MSEKSYQEINHILYNSFFEYTSNYILIRQNSYVNIILIVFTESCDYSLIFGDSEDMGYLFSPFVKRPAHRCQTDSSDLDRASRRWR